METLETPQPITETKTTNWTKVILVAVLGFGLLAGSAYAGYWYGTLQVQPTKEPTPVVSQPTPTSKPLFEPTPAPTPIVEDETADWKTYINTKYGYSAKYPQDWVKLEEGDKYVRFFKGPYEEGMPTTQTYISISLEDNPSGLSLEDWIGGNPPPYGEAESTRIGGQGAVKYVSGETMGRGGTLIYSKKDSVIYKLALILRGADIEEAIQTFDQILPTFHFLD